MQRRIAYYGGSFNPPAFHHVEIVERLTKRFDGVRVIPCGARVDKHSVNEMDPKHRRAMAGLAFGRFGERVVLDFSDLDACVFTPSYLLIERAPAEVDSWLVVGSDLTKNGGSGHSPIHSWQRGAMLWGTAQFVIVEREGYSVRTEDLPPKHLVIGPPLPGASNEIRQRLQRGQSVTDLVSPEIGDYIAQHELYKMS